MPNSFMNQAAFKRTLLHAIAWPLLIMAMLVGIMVWQIGNLLAATRLVGHTDQVIGTVRLIQKDVSDMRSGLRSYVILQDPQYLQRYTQARSAFDTDMALVQRLTTDNPHQQRRLAQIRVDYARWFANLDKNKALPTRDFITISKPGADTLNTDFEDFAGVEADLRRTRVQVAQQSVVRTLSMVLVSAFLIGLLMAFINRRQLQALAGSYSLQAKTLQSSEAHLALAFNNIRDNEEQLHAIFELAAVGIAQVGADFQWLRVNQKLCDILGYQREELFRCSFDEIAHPDDRNVDLPYAQRMLAGEIQTYCVEKRNIHKNGAVICTNLTVSLVRTPDGRPKYFICIVEDITERKRMENQLLQAQKLESIGRLAGGVAHDFNNLLTVILGYAEMAEEEYESNVNEPGYLANIIMATEKAAHLTGQLLAFARKQVVEPKVVNVNDLILSVHKMLRRLIGENIELVMLPQEHLHDVRVDPGQFEQIIVNLVVNARDAMPDGGKITIETGNALLDADYASRHECVVPGDYVLLAVSDTGSGMDESIRLHVFDPFFTTKEKGRGTGLGLATVYGIVRQAGGHIWLYSEVGQGTTFKIYLPRTTEALREAVAPQGLSTPSDGSELILLVEDEPAVRALSLEMLLRRGYTVLDAMNGEEALRVAKGREHEIALLITDVIMPQMSGKELVDRLHRFNPDLSVLYVSGYTENTIVHHGVLAPDILFLSKPFNSTGLTQRVREILDRSPPVFT